jgi:UDP-GlcNAc:undecaprenyl-phosphate GlcNAc-1-phosphate transferase
VREYLLVFLTSAVVSYLLCVVARELAMRLNAVARVRDRDVHAVPIPYMGGVAMLGGLWAGLLLAHHLPFLSLSQPQVFTDARVVLVGGTIICLVGVVDDVLELDALTKLGGQVVAAGYLVLNGVQLYSIRIPGQTGQLTLDQTQAVLLSMVLIVGTVNAINFVDGLDGLAGGMVCIGAFAFFVFSYRLADVNNLTLAISGALLCACLAGACVGFLPHNFYPARIFMGDSGSMLLGLVLSGSTLTLTGQFAGVQLSGTRGTITTTLAILLPILLPISILVVPLVDLVLAVVRRTRRGQMFYQPDKEHLHHRLLEVGHSQRRAVLIMWMWSGLIGVGAVVISLYTGPISVIAVGVAGVVTLLLTFVVPQLQKPAGRRGERASDRVS